MKSTLIYDGDLPRRAISQNLKRPVGYATNCIIISRSLEPRYFSRIGANRGTIPNPGAGYYVGKDPIWSSSKSPDRTIPYLPAGRTNRLSCEAIPVANVGSFIPIYRQYFIWHVRSNICFLRHEEPFNLMRQGGDLDGQIKTLFDALKMPDPKNEYIGDPPAADPLYVVLEDDALISDVSIKSGKLLGNRTKDKHAVRLTIDVTIKVLRVFYANQCLIGG